MSDKLFLVSVWREIGAEPERPLEPWPKGRTPDEGSVKDDAKPPRTDGALVVLVSYSGF